MRKGKRTNPTRIENKQMRITKESNNKKQQNKQELPYIFK
jgi:hypothetical protein